MPGKTILEIPDHEQQQMLKELRQARFGYLLALHILVLCAQGRTPSEIADFLLCSRSSVYRTVNARSPWRTRQQSGTVERRQ